MVFYFAPANPREISCVQMHRLTYYGANRPPPSPSLTREQEQAAFKRYARRKTAKDREALVRQYLCWAFGMAAKYRGPRLDFDEAVSVANEGLMEAIDRYNPSLGFRFTTYAAFVVRRKLIQAIVNTYPVRVSDHIRKKLRALEESPEKQAQALLNNEPGTLEEFFDRLASSTTEAGLHHVSSGPSDGGVGFAVASVNNGGVAGGDQVLRTPLSKARPDDTPSAVLEETDRGEALLKAVEALPFMEREVVRARYLREQPESYPSIGKRLKVSKVTVKYAGENALRKLRHFFHKDAS